VNTDDAKNLLEEMLGAAGVRADAPEFEVVWEVFRRFAALAVDDVDIDNDGDLVLFETLELDSPTYEIQLTRQFSFTDDAGEYDGMEHLTVSVSGTRAPAKNNLSGAVVWGVACPRSADAPHEGIHPDLRTWAQAVEAEPAFAYTAEVPLDRLSVSHGTL
jgi:hypothetical protein